MQRLCSRWAATALVCAHAWGAGYRIETVAGSASIGDGGPAVAAQFGNIQGVALDRSGNVYIADTDRHRVRKVSANGIVTTIAGTGLPGFSGDGGAATAAALNSPYGLAVDPAGTLYIADLGNGRVRRVTADGIISTAAAQLNGPRNLAVDFAANLYISEFLGHRVRRLGVDGRISIVAGTGAQGYAGDGGQAIFARLAYPAGLAVDASGTVYVADSQNHRVRRFLPGGPISTILGGNAGTVLYTPLGLAADAAGNLFVADNTATVRMYSSLGVWSTIAGFGIPGFNGDGAAVRAQLTDARDLAVDGSGLLYIADGTLVRRVDAQGMLLTIAGTRSSLSGDGGPPAAATLQQPSAVAISRDGALYIAEKAAGRVRRVFDGVITTYSEGLEGPMAVALDPFGNLAVADSPSDRIVQVQEDRRTGVLVASGLSGPRGVCYDAAGMFYIVDTAANRILRNGIEIPAELREPSACAADAAGNVFIADTKNSRIRKITPGGIMTTVPAGSLSEPAGVAIAENGDLFISDTGHHRIVRVAPDGAVETIAGGGTPGFGGDGGPAVAGTIHSPGGLAVDAEGNVYFADTGNNRVRRVVPAPDEFAEPPALTAVHGASLLPGPVAPGQILAIFGNGLGPEAGVAGTYDNAGRLGITAGGSEVRFDGVAAPVLYAQANQVNVQAPYSIAGANSTRIEVYYQGRLAGVAELAVASANPAIFPAVLNPDGSLNSEESPTAPGSVVTFYATGEGLTNGPNIAGQKAQAPYPRPVQPVELSIAGIPAELLYAASAPGLVGYLQIDARVPGGFATPGSAPAELRVGNTAAPAFTIWVK